MPLSSLSGGWLWLVRECLGMYVFGQVGKLCKHIYCGCVTGRDGFQQAVPFWIWFKLVKQPRFVDLWFTYDTE